MFAALEYVHDLDTLVIHPMDRLARSLDHLHKLVVDLSKRGVVVVQFVKESLTFNGADVDAARSPCSRRAVKSRSDLDRVIPLRKPKFLNGTSATCKATSLWIRLLAGAWRQP